MLHLKTAPCPDSLIQSRSGDITMDHIDGASILSWPKPCGGGLIGIAHISRLWVLDDSPKGRSD